jgi:hypothetical protein
MSFPFIIQGSNIVVVINNKPHTITTSHISYEKIKQAIKNSDWASIEKLVDPVKQVINYSNGNVTVVGDVVCWQGRPLHGTLVTRIVQMLKDEFPVDPLVNFIDNLMQNPSKRAVTELYSFLEVGNLPITPDGHFLAYKRVKANYTDIYTGEMDNSVGSIVEMARNDVDEDKDRTCSSGLHFCSEAYLSHSYVSSSEYPTMILKINPRDVVSIPSDYNNTKGRACRYEILSELEGDVKKAFTKSVQETANGVKQPVKKAEPAKPVAQPKEGTGSYVQGYEWGYAGHSLRPADRASIGFVDGYTAGYADRVKNQPRRFKLVVTKGLSQEYDARGRPLSMTKSAIRKRAARRAARRGK